MNKEKLFSYKDQEIINEYNKKRSKEITEEHLNNIEKLRENFKKEAINQYKKNLIKYLTFKKDFYNKNSEKIAKGNYWHGWNCAIFHYNENLIEKIENGEFDND